MNGSRLEMLREGMQKRGVDGLLVSDRSSRDYLIGTSPSFTGDCLITKRGAYFLTDFIDYEEAKRSSLDARVVLLRGRPLTYIRKLLHEDKVGTLGIDFHRLSHSRYLRIKKIRGPKVVDVPGIVERLRMIKDNGELERIRKACKIACHVFSQILKKLKPGLTEKDIADEIGCLIRRKGAGVSFDVIVASGVRSSFPHGLASKKKIRGGDAVVIDLGAKYKGYHSDFTRTVFMGRAGPIKKRVYGIVKNAQSNAAGDLKDGVACGRIDSAARSLIRKKGYGKYFGHSLGHGVGMDIHEGPRLGKGERAILKKGMVVTVEPGVYLPGAFGVRIEDTVLVGKNGPEILTDVSRELTVI